MKKLAIATLAAVIGFAPLAAVAAEDAQTVHAEVAPMKLNAGMMLYAANGFRVAPIYRVTTEGNPQVILNGKLVTVPASTLSDASGKVMTSLTKQEIGKTR